MQAAYDSIDGPENKLAGGGTLYFPAGDYRCEIDASNSDPARFRVNTRLLGDGRHASRIVSPRTGAILLNMLGRNDMTVENLEFWSTDFESQCGIYLCRSDAATQCNNNKFIGVEVYANFTKAAVVSIGAESSLWLNCRFNNTNTTALNRCFFTGGDPSRLPLTLPDGMATPIIGPNTDNRMISCEVYVLFDGARPFTFSSTAGWMMVGCTVICGNHSNIHMATYTDPVGNNFNGPVTWIAPHFEAFGTGNVIHYLDASGADSFYNITHEGGFVVMTAGMIVDYDRTSIIKQPIMQGCTFTTAAYPPGVSGMDINSYAFSGCHINWRPRGNPVAAVVALGFSAGTTIDAAMIHVSNLGGNSRLVVPVTAIPDTGTYAKGTRFENVSGTVGQPTGWVISTAGSFGSVGSVVASTTAGTNAITIGAPGNLYVGCLIDIATATGGPFVVQRISGGTVHLDKMVTNSVLGQSVTFVTPTATPLANL